MPALNSIKIYTPDTYYHVYNRGLNKDFLFRDHQDYSFFLKLLRRYLDPSYRPSLNETIRPSYATDIDLIAYCLMPNHFHLLLYQKDDEKSLELLNRSLMTAYVMYYNQKYKRIGPLFQGRYRASLIDNDPYLYHISRYIHLNPLDIKKPYQSYEYSSYRYYLRNEDSYLKKDRIMELFKDTNYIKFVEDHVSLFKERSKADKDDFGFPGQS